MTKIKIALNTKSDISDFVNAFDREGYVITDGTGKYCVAARSLIGVMYAWSEWNDMYLVNENGDDEFPVAIERFRA